MFFLKFINNLQTNLNPNQHPYLTDILQMLSIGFIVLECLLSFCISFILLTHASSTDTVSIQSQPLHIELLKLLFSNNPISLDPNFFKSLIIMNCVVLNIVIDFGIASGILISLALIYTHLYKHLKLTLSNY